MLLVAAARRKLADAVDWGSSSSGCRVTLPPV